MYYRRRCYPPAHTVTMFSSTFKNFIFSFDNMDQRRTVSSGELLTGRITFELAKQTKVSSITISLSGKVSVHWSRGGGKKSSRRNYSARLTLFDFNNVLMQNRGDSSTLQPGTHVYPFSCQLPHGDFPTSFHGVHGNIVYNLTVGINRPWHLMKTFVSELNYVNRIDTSDPVLHAPLAGTNSMSSSCLWCTSGPISLSANTERKAFNPGETVKLFCEFSNASSKSVRPLLRLLQKTTFYTHNRVTHTMEVKKLASVSGDVVGAHTPDTHTVLTITIPTSGSLSIANCSILEVEHFVEVSLHVRACKTITVLFPIVLCDTPVLVQSAPETASSW